MTFEISRIELAVQIDENLFPIHRAIERCYACLPWPRKIRQISVVTFTPTGKGDVSTAAKVIALLPYLSGAYF